MINRSLALMRRIDRRLSKRMDYYLKYKVGICAGGMRMFCLEKEKFSPDHNAVLSCASINRGNPDSCCYCFKIIIR